VDSTTHTSVSTPSLHDALPIFRRLRKDSHSAPFLGRAARLRRLRKDSHSAPFLGRARLRRLRKDFHSASFLRGHDFAGCEKTLRSEEHTSELQSLAYLVCRLLL